MLEFWLFLIALIGTVYSYFIYPLSLYLLLLFSNKTRSIDGELQSELPKITFIITAYNEERNIRQKLDNTLACHYPGELEILVASDGSTDLTNAIVKDYENQGVVLVEVAERLGKENAQQAAINRASGEILVFSDVATRIDPDALELIARGFNDPKIGAISSEDRFLTKDGKLVGEGAYVKYEMWLRRLESKVNSLVGLSGSFFAARKSVCELWNIKVPSDFNTAINCVKLGLKAVSDPKLLGYYPNLKNESNEYQRKLRTVIRGMAALGSNLEVLNPFKYGLFAYQIFGHKIMRWSVPWFLLLLLISNLMLIELHWFFKLFFLGQLTFYALAAIGACSKSLRKNGIVKLCYFFVQVNVAIFQALIQYILGKRIVTWEPSKR